MRWRRIAFWVTFSTLALIVLALTWLWTADLGVFKPQLERLVTQELGHEFEIRGEFHVDLAGQTTVVAEDLHFANAPWADEDDMVTIGRAELRFDLWSLFRGLLLLELLDLDDTNILLLNPGDSAPNWDRLAEWFAEPSSLEVLLGVVDIDRLRLRLDSAERERPLNLEVAYFHQRHRDDGFLDLRLDAMLDGKVVRAEGELGTWDALVAGKNLEFDVEAVLDTFDFSAAGRIDDLANPLRPEFQFSAAGPDIDDLTRLLGLGEEGDGDIKLAGALKPIADGPLSLSIRGNLGQTEIDAVGEAADLKSLEKLQLKATASGPDLGRVLRLAGMHQVRESPFMLKFDAEMEDGLFEVREASMVFADASIEGSARFPRFPSIDDAVISLQIEGPSMERFRYVTGIPGTASGPFSLGFTVDVREDGVEVLELNAKTSLGELRGSGSIGDPDTFLGSTFNVEVRAESLARLAGAYGIEGMPDKPAEIAGAAEYTADGIRTRGAVSLEIEGNSATVEGLVPLSAGAVGADLQISAEGADLTVLAGLFTDAAGVPALPYRIGGGLRIAEEGYRFNGIAGTLGSTAISGEGLLVVAETFAGTRFDIQAGGPAFEELIEALEDVDVDDGFFELSGKVLFGRDRIELQKVSFERPRGKLEMELALGLPLSRRWADFSISASGNDVRSILGKVDRLVPYEQPFSLQAHGSLRDKLLDFDKLNGAIGTATFVGAGDLALDGSATRSEFTLSLSMPDLADIGTFDGRKFNRQAFTLSAHAIGEAGVISVDGMHIGIGESEIDGSIELRSGDIPGVHFAIRSDRLDYLPLLEDVEEEYDPEPEFDDGRLIPDIAMPFDAMQKFNASLAADIRELERGKLYLTNIEIDAELRDGVLDIPLLQLGTRSGELVAKGSLSPGDGAGEASLQVVARRFAPGFVRTNVDLATKSDLDIDLRSTGADLRALAGNLNGVIYFDARGGRIETDEMISAIYGDMLEEMLNTINPLRKTDPYTDFECLIMPLAIEDGQVEGAPSIFVSTEKMRAVVQGSLDLNTEEIQLGVRTTPRRVVSFSAAELFNPYVQVVGTLASPRLAVDEAGVLITGGAAVATGGLSLLARGLWDRLSKSGDPCNQLSGQALKALEGRLPDLAINDIPRLE